MRYRVKKDYLLNNGNYLAIGVVCEIKLFGGDSLSEGRVCGTDIIFKLSICDLLNYFEKAEVEIPEGSLWKAIGNLEVSLLNRMKIKIKPQTKIRVIEKEPGAVRSLITDANIEAEFYCAEVDFLSNFERII